MRMVPIFSMIQQSESEDFMFFEELDVLSKGPDVWSLNICHEGLRRNCTEKQLFKSVLWIRIRDPVLFLPLDPGWEKPDPE